MATENELSLWWVSLPLPNDKEIFMTFAEFHLLTKQLLYMLAHPTMHNTPPEGAELLLPCGRKPKLRELEGRLTCEDIVRRAATRTDL